jgi:hypothetical protein
MNVVFFTLGSRGSGSIVICLSLLNGLRRAGLDANFTIVSDNQYHHITEGFCDHIHIHYPEDALLRRDRDTPLYHALTMLKPDILIVNQVWLHMFPILDDFDCVKVFTCRMAPDRWWHVPIPDNPITFTAEVYDLAYSIEPNYRYPGLTSVDPVIIRNREEILDVEAAAKGLGKKPGEKLCVIAHNGLPGEMKELYEGLSDLRETYKILQMDNSRETGIFPIADYMAAIDLFVSGGGYNAFYEALYFNRPCRFLPFKRNKEDQTWRIDTNSQSRYEQNGADQIGGDIIELVRGRAGR